MPIFQLKILLTALDLIDYRAFRTDLFIRGDSRVDADHQHLTHHPLGVRGAVSTPRKSDLRPGADCTELWGHVKREMGHRGHYGACTWEWGFC